MDIDKWVAGCRVRAFDWIDGKNIYMNITYHEPGRTLSKPPLEEKTVLIPKEEEQKVKDYLHSIVTGLMYAGYEKGAK